MFCTANPRPNTVMNVFIWAITIKVVCHWKVSHVCLCLHLSINLFIVQRTRMILIFLESRGHSASTYPVFLSGKFYSSFFLHHIDLSVSLHFEDVIVILCLTDKQLPANQMFCSVLFFNCNVFVFWCKFKLLVLTFWDNVFLFVYCHFPFVNGV